MTLRETLELAGYRLRALARHMPTEWQKNEAMRWADDAVRAAQGIEARRAIDAEGGVVGDESPVAAPSGDAPNL